MSDKTLLVLGGSGVFGERLCRRLAPIVGLRMVIAGRSLERAQKLVAELTADDTGASFEATRLDIHEDLRAFLERLKPFLVINLVGPFQSADYTVPKAAIEAGAHYIDISDGRAFVAGFAELDGLARSKAVSAITGASSTPAISAAAVEALIREDLEIDSIDVGITPGNRVRWGAALMQAILSYVGRPVRVFYDGVWQDRPGWDDLTREALPGIGKRWLSLCDTPDLDVLQSRFQPKKSVMFRAGLELSALHLGLWSLGQLVRLGFIKNISSLAGAFKRIGDLLYPLGSDRGGMAVHVTGTRHDGVPVHADWFLIAQNGDGPYVPILPVVALLRRLVHGQEVPIGAHVGAGLLTLDDLKAEYANLAITTRYTLDRAEANALYTSILLSDFDRLPQALRDFHSGASGVYRGRATVGGATNYPIRIMRRLFDMPPPADNYSISVTVSAESDRETWTRDFDGNVFSSRLTRAGDNPYLLEETFGPLNFGFDLCVEGSNLALHFRRWRFYKVPLPSLLAPRINAREFEDDKGRFNFDIEIRLPLIGTKLITYKGYLSTSSGTDAG